MYIFNEVDVNSFFEFENGLLFSQEWKQCCTLHIAKANLSASCLLRLKVAPHFHIILLVSSDTEREETSSLLLLLQVLVIKIAFRHYYYYFTFIILRKD